MPWLRVCYSIFVNSSYYEVFWLLQIPLYQRYNSPAIRKSWLKLWRVQYRLLSSPRIVGDLCIVESKSLITCEEDKKPTRIASHLHTHTQMRACIHTHTRARGYACDLIYLFFPALEEITLFPNIYHVHSHTFSEYVEWIIFTLERKQNVFFNVGIIFLCKSSLCKILCKTHFVCFFFKLWKYSIHRVLNAKFKYFTNFIKIKLKAT